MVAAWHRLASCFHVGSIAGERRVLEAQYRKQPRRVEPIVHACRLTVLGKRFPTSIMHQVMSRRSRSLIGWPRTPTAA